MKKNFPLEKMDLALFERGQSNGPNRFSQLRDFISFLKLYNYPAPYKFSHVEASAPLIENLSLDENLLLHASDSGTQSKEAVILDMLEKSGNPHLKRLYDSVRLKSSKPSQVDDETRKAIALIKALVQRSDFLFLECPERYLGKELLSQFIQALVYKSATTGLMVVVSTEFKKIWAPHLTKRIFRDEKNYFQVKQINNSFEKGLLKLEKTQKSDSEGHLKIVNHESEDGEENKKSA